MGFLIIFMDFSNYHRRYKYFSDSKIVIKTFNSILSVYFLHLLKNLVLLTFQKYLDQIYGKREKKHNCFNFLK